MEAPYSGLQLQPLRDIPYVDDMFFLSEYLIYSQVGLDGSVGVSHKILHIQ